MPDSADNNARFPEPSINPSESGALRRSSLLGQRKKASHVNDKPITFSRKEKPLVAEPAVPSPPPPPAARARATPKAKASPKPRATKKSEIEELRGLLETVSRELSKRPSWEDLDKLEARLRAELSTPGADGEQEELQEQLQNREEELEELASVVQEFQDQVAESQVKLLEMQRAREEDQLARRQLEELLNEALQRAEQLGQEKSFLEDRLVRAQGFLRDALLGLLSPGDEFNEELVEQIQHFLTRDT